MAAPAKSVRRDVWQGGRLTGGTRTVPEETPIAFSYDGSSWAVMMATPADLRDFAIGFSLTEGIVASPAEIVSLDIVEEAAGIELRMRLATPRAEALAARRRMLTGPVGCGLCGIESIDEALRPVPAVLAEATATPADVDAALAAMAGAQKLNRLTHAVHAAAFWTRDRGLVAVREDVGRHNALDKLAGALAGEGIAPATGLVLLTSRLSVELVQKAAVMGAPILVSVSAPTALALSTAEAAGISVVAVARADGFEIFTKPQRIAAKPARNVAS
jgi:FdhD protein